MSLKRYRIDGRALTTFEISNLCDLLNKTAFISTVDLKNHGMFEAFYDEAANIKEFSPLLAKCIITDITQIGT